MRVYVLFPVRTGYVFIHYKKFEEMLVAFYDRYKHSMIISFMA